eukprot:g16266.t1
MADAAGPLAPEAKSKSISWGDYMDLVNAIAAADEDGNKDMHFRRLAAALPDAIETKLVEVVKQAWRDGNIPVLRIEIDATNLSVLLPSPIERELLKGGSKCVLDPSSKFLCALLSIQVLEESGTEWRLSNRITAPLPSAVLPSAPIQLTDANADLIKKIPGQETGKIVRIAIEHLKPVLHRLFHLPAETPIDNVPGRKPTDNRALFVDFMGDSGGSAVPVQTQIVHAVGFWSASCSYPLFTTPGFCEEHPAQTLQGESSSGIRKLMVPLELRKTTAGKSTATGTAGFMAGQTDGDEFASTAAAPDTRAVHQRRQQMKSKQVGGKKRKTATGAAAADKKKQMEGATYRNENVEYVKNPKNMLLLRRSDDAAPQNPAGDGFTWEDVDADHAEASGDDDDSDEANEGGGGEPKTDAGAGVSHSSCNEGAQGKSKRSGKNGNGDEKETKPMPKKKSNKRKPKDYYTQFSFALSRLIAQQRWNFFQVMKTRLNATGPRAVVEWWPKQRAQEFEAERRETQALLERHLLWDRKKRGEDIAYALTGGKIVLLEESEATVTGVLGQLLALMPNTPPGSETRWWSIASNSRLGVGFGLLRMCWDDVNLSGIHTGNGDYTPDNFSISQGSKVTAVDWSVLCHHVELASGAASAASASIYRTARVREGLVDLSQEQTFRLPVQTKKFHDAIRSAMNELRPKFYDRDVLRLTGGNHQALEYHRPMRVDTVAAVMKALAGYYWRFSGREGFRELFYWLSREVRSLGAEADEEAQVEKLDACLNQKDLLTRFRTKTMSLLDSGLVQQLQKVKRGSDRLRHSRAALAYAELCDPQSAKVEFQHQILQACQQMNGAWKGDKALNALAYSSFISRTLSVNLEEQLQKVQRHLVREEKERLMFQCEVVRFKAEGPRFKYRAWLRGKTDEALIDDEAEREGGMFSQATYKKHKMNPATVKHWFEVAAEISTELGNARVSNIEELEKKKAELQEEIKRRKPAKEWWQGVMEILPEHAGAIPVRRVREFERDLIFDFEKRAYVPLVDINLKQDYPEQLDVFAPELVSPLGRFVGRVLKSKQEQWRLRQMQDPLELLAFVEEGEIYVLWWVIGNPAGFAAISVGTELGEIDFLALLKNDKDVKVKHSYDAELQQVSKWTNFFFVKLEESWESYRHPGILLTLSLVSTVDRDEFLKQPDRSSLYQETGEKIKPNEKFAPEEQKKPSDKIRVGVTVANWLDLLESGRYCTARLLVSLAEKRRRRQKFERKVRRARKLGQKKKKDAELAAKAKLRATFEGITEEQFEEIESEAITILEAVLEEAIGWSLEQLEETHLLDNLVASHDEAPGQEPTERRDADPWAFVGGGRSDSEPDEPELGQSPFVTAAKRGGLSITEDRPDAVAQSERRLDEFCAARSAEPHAVAQGGSSHSSIDAAVDVAGPGGLKEPSRAADDRDREDQQPAVAPSASVPQTWQECFSSSWEEKVSRMSKNIFSELASDRLLSGEQGETVAGEGCEQSNVERSNREQSPLRAAADKCTFSEKAERELANLFEGSDPLPPDFVTELHRQDAEKNAQTGLAAEDGRGGITTADKNDDAQLALLGSASNVKSAAAEAKQGPGVQSQKRDQSRRSPEKNATQLRKSEYDIYREKLLQQKGETEDSLGGFELLLRGNPKFYKKAKNAAEAQSSKATSVTAGKQFQARPKPGTREGDNCLRIHQDYPDGWRWLVSQQAVCLKQKDFLTGGQEKAEDFLRLWIARARYISQRMVKSESMLARKAEWSQFSREQRVKLFPADYAKYIEPYLARALSYKTGKQKLTARELEQIEPLKTLPEAILHLLTTTPAFLTGDGEGM